MVENGGKDSSVAFRNQVLEGIAEFRSKLKEIEVNGRTSTTEVWHEPRRNKQKIYARVRCNVISVGEIDTVKQQFDAEIFLGVTYKEPELKDLTREDVDWEKMWSPRVVFLNAEQIHSMECKHRIVHDTLDNDGIPDAFLSYRMKATFKTTMELNHFPIDYQKLTIKIVSDWPEVAVQFVKDVNIKDSIRTDVFSGCHEWELCPALTASAIKGFRVQTSSHQIYPNYHLTMYVKRKGLYYFWNLALVLILIVSLSFTSFAVSADQPEDRLSVTLTLLLTAVAFKYVAAQALPPISYLTLLDKYVIFCLVFQCVAVCQNAIVSVFRTAEDAALFDMISAYTMLGLLVLVHLTALVYIYITKVKSDREINKAVKDYEELNERINKAWIARRDHKLKSQVRDKDVSTDGEERTKDKPKSSKRRPRQKKNKIGVKEENKQQDVVNDSTS